MTFPLYPNVLRRVADLCEGLDKVDYKQSEDLHVFLQNGIPVMDDDDVCLGVAKDDGAGWCFYPASEDAA